MIRRSMLILVWAMALVGLLLAGAFAFAQTGAGKRLIAEQIGRALSTADTAARVVGLQGLIPFDFRLEQLRLADAAGSWLELDDLRVSWSAAALLRGRLEIDQLSAGRLALVRLPPGEDADEAETLPELPSSVPPVVVRSLSVDRLEIGEELLGQDAVFRLAGGLETAAGRAVDLTLDLQRTDRTTAQASIQGRLDLAARTLALDVGATETGGLLATLTGRPNAGDFTLALTGKGPLADWAGDLRLDAQGLAHVETRIGLALAETLRVRLDGALEPAPGLPPPPAEALVGERLQLALTAAQPAPDQLAIENLRATTARVTMTGSARVNLAAERLAARANVVISDLSPLGDVLNEPLAGSLEATVDVDGPLLQPKGRVALTATDLAAAEVHAREVRTTLDLAMLDRLGAAGARVQLAADGGAKGLRLPPEVAVPPQDVVWQAALTAPVDGAGSVAVERLSVAADHLTLTAQGTLDASTLGGEAQVRLAVDALAPFAEGYGQPITGAAELEAHLGLGPGAEPISVDLYGKARELSGLPQGLGELVGATPTLEANAIVALDDGVQLAHLRLEGADVSLDGRLDLALPEQTLDGSLALDLVRLAPLSPLLGVEVDGPLKVRTQLGGSIAAPAIEIAAQSPGLLVAGEHIDRLEFEGSGEGTAEVADGKLRIAVSARAIKAELATAFALRTPVLRLSDLALRGPRTRIGGALSVDLESQLVEGELNGRIDQLRAFAALLPVRLAGELDLEARASVENGTQIMTLAGEGNGLVSDFGRLRQLNLQATVSDPIGTPRLAADLTVDDFSQGDVALDRGSVRAEGTPQALELTLSAAGEAYAAYDLDARAAVALGDQIRVQIAELSGNIAQEALALRGPMTVSLAGEDLAVEDLDLRLGQARLSGALVLGPREVSANAALEQLPLPMLARFGGPELNGEVAGRLSLQGPTDNPRGSIELNATDVALAAPTLVDVPPAALSLAGTLEARRLRLELRGEGVTERPLRATAELPLVVDLVAGAFAIPGEGQMAGRLNAELALARLAEIAGLDDQRLEGPLVADLTVAGTVAEPAVDGTVRIEGALYENGATGTVLRDLNLLVRADRRTIAIERFGATDGGQGRLTGEGTIALDEAAGYPVDLRLRAERARLVARDDVVATASADLALAGRATAPQLRGEVTVNRAEITIPERLGPSVAVIPVKEIGRDTGQPPPPADGAPAFVLRLDLTVAVPNQVFVRGRGLDSEWEGRLLIEGTAAEPRVSGTLRVRRGSFELLGQRFELRQGVIQFDGQTPPNPELNVEAVTRAADITAVVRITGEATSPQFALDSEPSMPEDEIVSRLLFNRAAGRLGPADALRLAAAVNTLRGGGLGVLGQARQALGLDTLRVSGEGVQDARVSAGRYINDRVFVEVGKGAATDSEDVRVEVEILPNLSLDAGTNAQAQSGVGLKWRFDY